MNIASFLADINWNEDKPAIQVMLETSSTKEIRIAMRNGQHMKEHKAPFPIIVEMFEGAITFGVGGKKHALKRGDMLTLSAKVPHDLLATEESIVRLSLSKHDHTSRVENVSEK